MNLLFLTEIDAFPPNGGEKLRSYGLLKLMSELDLTVHAITGNSSGGLALKDNLKGIKFYTFDFRQIDSISSRKNYLRFVRRNKKLTLLINKIIQQNQIDIAFIDYYFYGQYISCFHKKGIPVIYGTHNAQARLIYQRPAYSILNRFTKIFTFLICRFHEHYFFRKADALIVVSDNDKEYYSAFMRKYKISVIPNFLIESDYPVTSGKKENYILMTANFYAYQNSIGLEWFIKEVWDHELWEKTELFLVGMGSDELYASLKEKYNLVNITSKGKVDDLKPYIIKAGVSIVPLLHGSGTRLKCLESMALKTQLVSTSKGAEGIDHDHSIIIADTATDFKTELLNVMNGKTDLTDRAYQVFLNKYAVAPNRKILSGIMQNLVNKTIL
jgi:hypothetical protein